jgi:hypothetical protein
MNFWPYHLYVTNILEYSFGAANANKAIEYRSTPQEGSIRLVSANAGIGSFWMGWIAISVLPL